MVRASPLLPFILGAVLDGVVVYKLAENEDEIDPQSLMGYQVKVGDVLGTNEEEGEILPIFPGCGAYRLPMLTLIRKLATAQNIMGLETNMRAAVDRHAATMGPGRMPEPEVGGV